MARISTYAVDNNIDPSDKVLGSDSQGLGTKNYTFQGIVNWFNATGGVAINEQNNYFFQSTAGNIGRQQGTVSFNSFGGVGTLFSAITQVKLAEQAVSGYTLQDYLPVIVGKNIMFAQLDNLNNFGIYTVVSITRDLVETAFFNVVVQFIQGHGALVLDKYYGISLTSVGSGSVAGVTATSPITSSGGTNPVISTSMAANKLIGRYSTGTGVMEEITIGTGLSLTGGTLNAAAGGITSINNLFGASQVITTGTAGTNFFVNSSGSVHTLNLPTASAIARGALSSADWSTFNSKQDAITLTTTGSSGSSTLISGTLNIPTYTLSGLGGVPTSRTLTINGTTYDLTADRSWTISTAGGLPAGGTAGQILTKVDATDYNATWQDNYADWTSVVKHIVKNNGLNGTITKGTAVYVTGSNGTNMLVGRASNTSEATSSKTMGLMQSDITTTGGTQTGFVITEGLISGLNTAGQTAGDPVWLGINGALIYGLTNKPYAPAHLVFIGIVTKVSAGSGEIFVKVQNGFELKEIHDVDIITTTPINGHVLGFDGTLWVNKTVAGWLGFTPVTNARTLTINGTAYDLTADRSWTITASGKSINVVSVNTNAGSASSTDYVYLASGTINVTLPTAVGNQNLYTIKNTGTGVITVNTTSSQTIDGSTTAPIKVQYLSLTIISDGANWNII